MKCDMFLRFLLCPPFPGFLIITSTGKPKEKVESVSFSDPRDFTKDFRVIRPVIIKGIHCQEMLWMPYKIPL